MARLPRRVKRTPSGRARDGRRLESSYGRGGEQKARKTRDGEKERLEWLHGYVAAVTSLLAACPQYPWIMQLERIGEEERYGDDVASQIGKSNPVDSMVGARVRALEAR